MSRVARAATERRARAVAHAAAHAVALRCALATPRWIDRRLPALLVAAAPDTGERASRAAFEETAAAAAQRWVALLARLPGARWRNTCLYRAAAECLARRHYGRTAVLRIGVRADGVADPAGIVAHAWVEEPPDVRRPSPTAEGYRVLRGRAAR